MPSLKNFKALFLILFAPIGLLGQELQFDVSINAEVVQTTERGIFTEMENEFERF